MKEIINRIAASFFVAIVFISCSGNTLDRDKAADIIKSVYPKAIEFKIFRGDRLAARRIKDSTDLEKKELINVQLDRPIEDVGKPFITFTDKASAFLLPTGEVDQSMDAQNIKIADEVFSDIIEIKTGENSNQAEVTFTVMIENITPFAVLLDEAIKEKQSRITYFSLNNGVWKWDEKIVKLPEH